MNDAAHPQTPLPPDVADALLPLDRRGFLRLLGALAAAGGAPLGCGGVPEALVPPPDVALEVLSPRHYAVFTAASLRLVGPRGAALIADRRVDPGRAADAWLARTPALGAALGQGLWLLELGVFPLLPKLRPFTALDGTAQDRVLDDLMRSRLDAKRDLFKGLKSLALLCFYGAPASHAGVGYPGPFGGSAGGVAEAMSYPVENAGERAPSPSARLHSRA